MKSLIYRSKSTQVTTLSYVSPVA